MTLGINHLSISLGSQVVGDATPQPITATVDPETSVLASGDALNDTTNWSTFLSTSNYASDAGTISSVVVNYIGDTPDATTALWGLESNHFSITVTDSAANERTFTTTARVVADTDYRLTVEGTSFTLPFRNVGTYSGAVDMGDGNGTQAFSAYNDAAFSATYGDTGPHTIRVRGQASAPLFQGAADNSKVRTVEGLGNLGWTRLDGAFRGCDGMTNFVSGAADLSGVSLASTMLKDCEAMVTADFRGVQNFAPTNIRAMADSNNALVNILGFEDIDTSNTAFGDEAFWNNPSLDATTIDISTRNFESLSSRSGIDYDGLFNFIPNNKALSQSVYDAFLLNLSTQTLANDVWFGFGSSDYTRGGAVEIARTALINAGVRLTDAGNATPETAAAGTISAITSSGFTYTLPADPFTNGLPIENATGSSAIPDGGRAIEISDDAGVTWTEYGDDYSEGEAVAITGQTADTAYLVRAVFANFNSIAEGVSPGATASVTTLVDAGPAVLTIDSISFIEASGGDAAAVDITYTYTGAGSITAYAASGDNPITVSDPQLKAGSGGTNTSEFFNWAVTGGSDQDDVAFTDETVDRLVVILSDGTVDSDQEVVVVTFPDVAAPTLVPASSTPADGATDIAINSNITLIFNETIVAGTGNFYIYEDGVLSETIAVGSATIGTTDVVLNPVSDLSNDVDVSVRWDAGVVEDAAGNGVAANATDTLLNFQTVAAAPTWTPADTSTKQVWLKADDAATITASGTDLTGWTDKSGNAVSVTISGAPQTNGSINGKTAIDFDGSDDYVFFNLGISELPSGGDIFVGIVCDVGTVTDEAESVIAANKGGSDDFQLSAGDDAAWQARLDGNFTSATASPVVGAGAHVLTILFDDSAQTGRLYVNGTLAATTTDFDSGLNGTLVFRLATNRGLNRYLDCTIGELLIDTDITIQSDFDAYAIAEWSIT